MITDLRDGLFAAGASTAFVAVGGLALGSNLIMTVGIRACGVVLLTYGLVAFGLTVANGVAVVRKAVSK